MKEGDIFYLAKDIYSVLRAKLRIHFYLERPHTQANLDELMGIIDEIEKIHKKKKRYKK